MKRERIFIAVKDVHNGSILVTDCDSTLKTYGYQFRFRSVNSFNRWNLKSYAFKYNF